MSREIPSFGWVARQPSYSASYLHPPIYGILERMGVQSVLDCGCGNGALCRTLTDRGMDCVGIDADATGVAVAKADHPDIPFSQYYFSDNPTKLFPGGQAFDAIVSTEVVEHLYAPHELVRFAFQAVKPGGIFEISTPYHGYLKNLVLSLVNGWDAHHHPLRHGGHIKFFSRSTLSKLLRDHGFTVESFAGAGRMPLLWKSMILVARRP